jgi:hypothetical protein
VNAGLWHAVRSLSDRAYSGAVNWLVRCELMGSSGVRAEPEEANV